MVKGVIEEWVKKGQSSEQWEISIGLDFPKAGRMALFIGAQFICKPKMTRSWKGRGAGRARKKRM